MNTEIEFNFDDFFLQTINADWLSDAEIMLDVLRLDVMHQVVGGNKWFKLKYYIKEAKEKNFDTVGTFGGAYSNHIIATAFACKKTGLNSIGFIRGEEPEILSHTLIAARESGMKLHFLDREAYKKRNIPVHENMYMIEEGGYGEKGMCGASEILLSLKNFQQYSHIICAVGTGTTLAGIINACLPAQKITGISVMKGNTELREKINKLLPREKQDRFEVLHNFHFGGYAKHPQVLINYMNELWQAHKLPTDFVYTAKTFYAIEQIARDKSIPKKSHMLMIHTGGLQGNLSLPENTLQF